MPQVPHRLERSECSNPSPGPESHHLHHRTTRKKRHPPGAACGMREGSILCFLLFLDHGSKLHEYKTQLPRMVVCRGKDFSFEVSSNQKKTPIPFLTGRLCFFIQNQTIYQFSTTSSLFKRSAHKANGCLTLGRLTKRKASRASTTLKDVLPRHTIYQQVVVTMSIENVLLGGPYTQCAETDERKKYLCCQRNVQAFSWFGEELLSCTTYSCCQILVLDKQEHSFNKRRKVQ